MSVYFTLTGTHFWGFEVYQTTVCEGARLHDNACVSLHCAVATDVAGTGWARVYSRRAMNKRC